MRLIVHPGYPKTATTWLQTHVLPQAGVWQLGKGSAGDGTENRWEERVRELHYRVFPSVYGAGRIWERFRTNTPALREYSDVLAGQLNSAATGELPASARRQGVADTGLAVLSDETMLAYGGAEMNAALLTYLLGAVRDRLREPDAFSCELVLTIREQASFLQSFFAYVFTLQRDRYANFDQFVAAGLAHPRAQVFGSLYYDDVVDFLAMTLPDFVRIRIVPYELLGAAGAVRFVDAFLDPASEAARRVADSTGDRVVNPSERGYPLRDFSPRRFLARSQSGRAAELTDEQMLRVRELYSASNRRLDKAFHLDLGQLGYVID